MLFGAGESIKFVGKKIIHYFHLNRQALSECVGIVFMAQTVKSCSELSKEQSI